MAAKTVEQKYEEAVESLGISVVLLKRETASDAARASRLDFILHEAYEAKRLLAASMKKKAAVR